MGAAREKDQADFDLERFVNMFDEAMTSEDPRVIETLRSLMMIVTLTRPESTDALNPKKGPLRRSFEEMNHMWKRFEQMEEELRQMHQRMSRESGQWGKEAYHASDYDKYTLAAAAQMAQQIDADVMRKVSADWTKQINGGLVPQHSKLSTKGLLKK
jgi:hypothetical protein